MRMSAVVFRVLNGPDFNNLIIMEVLFQVVFCEIMDRSIGSAFEGIGFSLLTLSEGRLFIRKNREKSESPRLQFSKTLLQKQFSLILTKKVQDIEAIDGIIPPVIIERYIQNCSRVEF